MSVPSVEFLVFAVVGALIFNLFRGLRSRAWVLASLNLAFFCSFLHGWLSAVPYAAFLALGYAGIRILRKQKSAIVFVMLVAAVLYAFFLVKRYSFIPAGMQIAFWYSAIGISYVFFRVMHLLIEVWQDSISEPVGPLSYFNYALNFPALVCGPIQRYEDYREMEEGGRPLALDTRVIGKSIERIVVGFFKVTVVSTFLLTWQKGFINSLSAGDAWSDRVLDLALICGLYPLYLYANFSGYTDFVIGVARLLRLELPENFNDPFSSESFIGFWSRWHMTLSSWLKDYVYTPLLMTLMRRFTAGWAGPYLAVFAYFVTFFLVGAWHGQTTIFLFFGVLQGGGVAVNKLYQVGMTSALGARDYRELCANPTYRACARGLTYTWFAFTLFWFWSDWQQLGRIAAAAGVTAAIAATAFLFAVATALLSLRAWLRAGKAQMSGAWWALAQHRYVRTAMVSALALFTFVVLNVLGGSPPDLVYKNF
jgi:alginate O-acetyltransferase complex protein AlgI